MGRVLILGAGVMGSALAVPAHDRGHAVTLATTPEDADVLVALRSDRGAHPKLGAPLPGAVRVVDAPDLTPADAEADLMIVGVASPGIAWAADEIARLRPACPVALVTKGLVPREADVPETYATAFPGLLAERGASVSALIGIGGPCIARELAERHPTAVVYASADEGVARGAADLVRTETYAVSTSTDIVGVEACAALKNFYAIGVSAMMGAHRRGEEPARNPVARAFQMAVDEMVRLVPWLGGEATTAHGLAGMGDLHVTVGGGRNARLGRHLGTGMSVAAVMDGPMRGETVEGVDVGRALAPALAAQRAAVGPTPLADAIIAAIGGEPFDWRAALDA